MAKIEDFGEKIGGAKKDLYYKTNGLSTKDYNEMSTDEKNIYMDKKFIFPKYNYDELKEKGLSNKHIMYIKKMWESIPNMHKDYSVLNENAWAYIKVCESLKSNIDKFIESDNRSGEFATNKPFADAMKEAGLWKEGNKWNYDDELFAFQKCINKKFVSVTPYAVLEELEKKPFYETTEEYADRMLLVYPIEKIDPETANMRALIGENFANREGRTIRIYNAILGKVTTHRFAVSEDKTYLMFDKRTRDMQFYNSEEAAMKEKNERKELMLKPLEASKSEPKKASKKKFVYSIVENIDRTGKPITFGQDVNGQDYLDTFKFRGGEFGNWLSDKERQITLNSGYEAFMDLATALDIEPKDISLNGKLSIAFGARGSGNALAHYEPARNVINLTKMKGAGSLAHEWGHALDYSIAKETAGKTGVSMIEFCDRDLPDKYGMKEVKDAINYKYEKRPYDGKWDFEVCANDYIGKFCFMIDLERRSGGTKGDSELKQLIYQDLLNQKDNFKDYFQDIKLPKATEYMKNNYHEGNLSAIIDRSNSYAQQNTKMKECLMNSEYTYHKVQTDFVKTAKEMDGTYSKTGHGYWQSDVELFARAFACYVTDKLEEKGIKSPYLSGHSEGCSSIPKGEERIAINKAIDKLVANMKEDGLFKEKEMEHTLITERHVEPEINMLGDIKVGEFMYIPSDEWKQKLSDLSEYKDRQEACSEYLDELGLSGETKEKLTELILENEQLER